MKYFLMLLFISFTLLGNESINIGVGQQKVIKVLYVKKMILNSKTINIQKIGNNQFLVTGKNRGRTVLKFITKNGEILYNVKVVCICGRCYEKDFIEKIDLKSLKYDVKSIYQKYNLDSKYIFDSDKMLNIKFNKNKKSTSYYKNGNKKLEYFYKDGKKDGIWTYYYKNGNRKWKRSYKKGIKNGEFFSWYKDGNKKEKLFYKNGNKNGGIISWYKNGNKKFETNFKNNKEVLSDRHFYYENGEIKEGFFLYIYPKGERKMVVIYKDGKKIGDSISWYDNGKVKSKSFHKIEN